MLKKLFIMASCKIFILNLISRGEVISKLEVQWSPIHNNKFITWGSDIRMYEVINADDNKSSKTVDYPKG